MNVLIRVIILSSACLFSGCAATFYNNDSPGLLELPSLFAQGVRLPLAEPSLAPYYVNGVLIGLHFSSELPVCRFVYNLKTYSNDARCEIKSVSIEGLTEIALPSTGDIKIELIEPMRTEPVYQVHREQGLHLAVGSLLNGVRTETLEGIIRKNGRITAVASVRVVNDGKIEERNIVFTYKKRTCLDF